MAQINIPSSSDSGVDITIETNDITAAAPASAAELAQLGVTRATKVTHAGTFDFTSLTMQELLDTIDATVAEARKVLTTPMLSVNAAGAALANLAGITKTIPANRPGTYLLLAAGMVGNAVAATGTALAAIAVNGAPVGVTMDLGAGTFIVNAKPERALAMVHQLVAVGGEVITLQGGDGAGVGNAQFSEAGIIIVPVS